MTTQQMLDERYGRVRSPRRRFATWGITTLLVVAVVGYFGWTTVSSSMTSVTATDTGYTVSDSSSVTIEFQISAPAGQPVACALEAQDVDHGTVGWHVVEYPASDDHTRAFSEKIPTLALATTGFVNSCWVP